MRSLRRVLAEHLASSHVARITYGSIIGLALVVALSKHPPGSGAVAALLVGTGLAVGLAEVYSEVLGTETSRRRRVERGELTEMLDDAVAVTFGATFPAVFFLLAAIGVIEDDTAFDIAIWSGLGLIAFYGYCAGRLAGAGNLRALTQALTVAIVGGALIALKAVLH